MSSPQESYHAGLDRVAEGLRAHRRLAEVSGRVLNDEARLMGTAISEIGWLAEAIEVAIQHVRQQVGPPVDRMHSRAVATQAEFHQAFPDIKDRPVLEVIAAGFAKWVDENQATRVLTASLKERLETASSETHGLVQQARGALHDRLGPVIDLGRGALEQNAALIQEVDAQRGIA